MNTRTATPTTNGQLPKIDLTTIQVKAAEQVQAEAVARAAQEAAQKAEATEQRPTFTPLTLSDLFNLPPKEWIVDQVIGKGDIGMMYGAPGSNKTFAVIDLIMAACTGQQWAMRFDIAQPLNVAYCAGEGVGGLPARFAAAAQHYGVTSLDNFYFFQSVPQLYGDDRIGICAFIDEWQTRQEAGEAQPLDILIIDTLHTAATAADENSARDMGQVLTACRTATKALGCAVILVHHTNKSGSAERGSSALRGAMDFMIEIKRTSDNNITSKATMHCAKLKDGEAWKDQTFDLVAMGDSVRVWWDEPSDSATGRDSSKQQRDIAEIIELLSHKPGIRYPAKEIAARIAVTQSHVNKLLKMAAAQDERVKSGLQDPDKDYSPRGNQTLYWYLPED